MEYAVKTASVHTHFELGVKLPYASILVSVPTKFHDCALTGNGFTAMVVRSFMSKWAAHTSAALGARAISVRWACADGALNLGVTTRANGSAIRIAIGRMLQTLKPHALKGIAGKCKRCVKKAQNELFSSLPEMVHVRVFAPVMTPKKSVTERKQILDTVGSHEWTWKYGSKKEETCPTECHVETSTSGMVSYNVGSGMPAVLALCLAQMTDGEARLCGDQLLVADIPLGKEASLRRAGEMFVKRWGSPMGFLAHGAALGLFNAATKHQVGTRDVDTALQSLKSKTPL